MVTITISHKHKHLTHTKLLGRMELKDHTLFNMEMWTRVFAYMIELKTCVYKVTGICDKIETVYISNC